MMTTPFFVAQQFRLKSFHLNYKQNLAYLNHAIPSSQFTACSVCSVPKENSSDCGFAPFRRRATCHLVSVLYFIFLMLSHERKKQLSIKQCWTKRYCQCQVTRNRCGLQLLCSCDPTPLFSFLQRFFLCLLNVFRNSLIFHLLSLLLPRTDSTVANWIALE